MGKELEENFLESNATHLKVTLKIKQPFIGCKIFLKRGCGFVRILYRKDFLKKLIPL